MAKVDDSKNQSFIEKLGVGHIVICSDVQSTVPRCRLLIRHGVAAGPHMGGDRLGKQVPAVATLSVGSIVNFAVHSSQGSWPFEGVHQAWGGSDL